MNPNFDILFYVINLIPNTNDSDFDYRDLHTGFWEYNGENQ